MIGNAVQQILGITIVKLDFFLLFLASVVIVTFSTFVLPKYFRSLNELRRIHSLDGIDEMVRACAEKGRPLNWGMPLPYTVAYFPAGLAVLRLTAKLCGDLSVPITTNTNDAQSYLMIMDVVRQGFTESAHPEQFNPNLHFFAASSSVTRVNIDNIERYNVAGNVLWGVYGGGHNPSVVQVARRTGAVTMAAIRWADSMAITLPWSEYIAIGEEMVASGAYLTKDPSDTAAIIGSDIIKMLFVAVLFGLCVKTLLGL